MKLEVTEETIKSYHNYACQSFKTRIEKDFPSLFEPVYEWQYVYYDAEDETHGLTMGFYNSKKDFSRRLYDLKPLHKLKESKRIRE